MHTPGHSAGATAFFFDLHETDITKRAGLCGVNGNLPLHIGRLLKYGIPLSTREQYLESIDNMMNLKVDITLDTHPRPGGVIDKKTAMTGTPEVNRFIDAGAWKATHKDYRTRFADLIRREQEKLSE